jgi:hypothetical protein
MKRLRVLLLVGASLALLGVALYWSPRRPTGFATPGECLEEYREAVLAGDVPRYLRCLAEPLQDEQRRSISPEKLRRQMEGVKSWTQLDPVVKGSAAQVEVDQVRRAGARRIRFHLRRSEEGWRIIRIDAPRPLRTDIPYGTPVDQVP